MKSQPLLEVCNLNSGYEEIQVLWDVNLMMNPAEIICIIGANGAGKSTLLKTIVGVISPFQGKIRYLGREITHLPTPTRIRMGLGFAPEGRHLFYGLTVEDNLLTGAFQRKSKKTLKEDLEFVYSLFKPLRGYRKKLAGDLSGGEQQMCSIGRALMSHPQLLVVDELSLGLAPVVVDNLIEAIVRLRDKRGIGLLLVEQDVQVALDIADRGYVLEAGAVALQDIADKLAKNEHIKTAYLGIV